MKGYARIECMHPEDTRCETFPIENREDPRLLEAIAKCRAAGFTIEFL